MNSNTQAEILELVQEQGPISSKSISEFLAIDKREVYTFLVECEKQDLVVRQSGKDGDTIVFKWLIVPRRIVSEEYGEESVH